MSILKSLPKLADELDRLGHTKEADKIDSILSTAAKHKKPIKFDKNRPYSPKEEMPPMKHTMGPTARTHREKITGPQTGRTKPWSMVDAPSQVEPDAGLRQIRPIEPRLPFNATKEQKEVYQKRYEDWIDWEPNFDPMKREYQPTLVPLSEHPAEELTTDYFEDPEYVFKTTEEEKRMALLSPAQKKTITTIQDYLERVHGVASLYEDDDTGNFYVLEKSRLNTIIAGGGTPRLAIVDDIIDKYLSGKHVRIKSSL